MPSDVVDLRDFYRTGLGQVARRMIRRAIQRVWPDVHAMRLLGIGYTTPFLSALSGETERTVALIFHALSAVVWVGGMFFAHQALRPAAAALDPAPRLLLWSRVLGRFFAWVIAAIALLLVSGYTLVFAVFGGFGRAGIHIHLMQGIGILMALYILPLFGVRLEPHLLLTLAHRGLADLYRYFIDHQLRRLPELGADAGAMVPDFRRCAAGGSDKADLRQAGGRARAAPAPRLRAGPARSVTEGIG